jgi:hypothetical protein
LIGTQPIPVPCETEILGVAWGSVGSIYPVVKTVEVAVVLVLVLQIITITLILVLVIVIELPSSLVGGYGCTRRDCDSESRLGTHSRICMARSGGCR